jgi:hypothetical protein
VVAARLAASADPALDVASYIGAFYGRYYFWVNVASVILQAFLVSRIVTRVGLAGALYALPIVAFGAYALVAAGAGLGAIRWAKGAENAVDYSAMNTGKQLLWLPLGREEKYEAKQAIDSFFVRAGDLLSAGVVFAGTTFLGAGIAGFAFLNLILVVLWVATAWALLGRYRSALRLVPMTFGPTPVVSGRAGASARYDARTLPSPRTRRATSGSARRLMIGPSALDPGRPDRIPCGCARRHACSPWVQWPAWPLRRRPRTATSRASLSPSSASACSSRAASGCYCRSSDRYSGRR